jgi:hypothetical protein
MVVTSSIQRALDVSCCATFDPRSGDLGVAAGGIVVDAAADDLVGEHDDDLDHPAAAFLFDVGLDGEREVTGAGRATGSPRRWPVVIGG